MRRLTEDLFIFDEYDRIALVAGLLAYRNSLTHEMATACPEDRGVHEHDAAHVDKLTQLLKGHHEHGPVASTNVPVLRNNPGPPAGAGV